MAKLARKKTAKKRGESKRSIIPAPSRATAPSQTAVAVDDPEASVCACDTDFLADPPTLDEDLPLASGGVEGDWAVRQRARRAAR